MNDLNEAAARLASGETYAGDVEDCIRVAQAYLARLAADEAERVEREGVAAIAKAMRAKLETIVCVEPPDDGIVLLSNDGKTHAETILGMELQAYDHQHFSELGDALMDLHGQLLDLLRALGAEVKGVENG